jgi:hypothetical protein
MTPKAIAPIVAVNPIANRRRRFPSTSAQMCNRQSPIDLEYPVSQQGVFG